MRDNLHSSDGRSENGRERAGREREAAPLSDREVPLNPRRRTPAAVHAWLDGELDETEVRRGDTQRDVEFWTRIAEQSEARRQMRTPAHLQAQIMAALPQAAPVMAEPWYRRSMELAPVWALVGGAALLAAGVAIGAAIVAR
jgi:hypothetical protein